jgi:hypothetical protein
VLRFLPLWLACLATVWSPSVEAQAVLRASFTPAPRAQIAAWLETAEGDFVATLKLTHGVGLRGIGNRPGALQMNSGFRWPYGRREGVLPVWAHARARGESLFPLVIFQERTSEGYASRNTNDYSADHYYCLSFDKSLSKQDALDAVSCASPFSSDKGRYMTVQDVANGYGEPFETEPGVEIRRRLALGSLYPPRRDLDDRYGYDHSDVLRFSVDARSAMPTLDAVSMATPAGNVPFAFQWYLSPQLPPGEYVLYVEANVEGDHNDTYSPENFPTPGTSTAVVSASWDSWARTFGYPYRGQPSVVYAVPFSVNGVQQTHNTSVPVGYGELHGDDGSIRPMDQTITDDPVARSGSGADRLRRSAQGTRIRVEVEFFTPEECMGALPVADELVVVPFDDPTDSHRFATVSFTPRGGSVPVFDWEVVVSRSPIESEEDFERATAANRAEIDTVALELCAADENSFDRHCPDLDVPITFDIGQLAFLTTHHVAVRAHDYCGRKGPIASDQVTTTAIHYTTVTPCFVATAAYGTPLASEIDVLRRFRDEVLLDWALGRAFVDSYYERGPALADWIRESEWRRAAVRAMLAPVVSLLSVYFGD